MSEKPNMFQRFKGKWRSRSRETRGSTSEASTPTSATGASLAKSPPELVSRAFVEAPVQVATEVAFKALAIVPQASSGVPQADESPLKPKPSIGQRLWDEAYDSIKHDDPKLVEGYEMILSRYLNGEISISDSGAPRPNIIASNPDTRREQMNELIRTGLEKTAREAKVKDGLSTALGIVLSLKEVVSAAITAVPQASIAWSGVCIALGVLESSVKETAMNRDGIEYVVARIRWYGNLADVLLEQSVLDGPALFGMKNELETRLFDLYKALLVYQMKSVYSFYRNRPYSFLRDLMKLDNWAVSIQAIQKAEGSLRDDVGVSGDQQVRSRLDDIANYAKRQECELQKTSRALEEQLRRQIIAQHQECLRGLWPHDPSIEKKRIEDTKGGLLQDSFNWILDNEDFQRWFQDPRRPLLWIRGDPGKGKTMLLCGIVDNLRTLAPSSLVSFFFCQATDQRINKSTAIMRGLLFLLIDQHRHLLKHLAEPYVRQGKALFEPPSAWYALSDIMYSVLQDLNDSRQPTCLLIDALDECAQEDLPRLLDFILKMSKEIPYVKWIVSSRNWQNITSKMEALGSEAQLSLELNAESVAKAVQIYINSKVRQLSETQRYDKGREDMIRDYLSANADGTFLWVALVCQNLESIPAWKALATVKAIPPGLEPFYGRMVESIRSSNEAEICKRILTVVTVAHRPLTLQELIALAETPGEPYERVQAIRDLIGQCGSFLTIREEVVYFVHQSAKDFLSGMMTKQELSPGMNDTRLYLVTRSMELMSQCLKRDIYQLSELGIHIDEAEAPAPDPLAAVGYSCVFWLDHFADLNGREDCETLSDEAQDTLVCQIQAFIGNNYLYWLEALSLLKKMPEGVVAMRKLHEFFKTRRGSATLIRDAYRFILAAKQTIEDYPLQVHPSALMICPALSEIRQLSLREQPLLFEMKHGIRPSWDPCLQTLKSGYQHAFVAISPNGKIMASTTESGAKIWDMATGTCLKSIQGPYKPSDVLLFSPDSRQVAATDESNGICIWNIESSELIMRLEDHNNGFCDLAFSPDGRLLASGSTDFIMIWDLNFGKCIHKQDGYRNAIIALAFSPDGRRLISCCHRGTTIIWDVAGNCMSTQSVHEHRGKADSYIPCISSDGSRIAFVSNMTFQTSPVVAIWDTASGQYIRTFKHDDWVSGTEFFPDGQQLVVFSSDEIQIWNSHGDDPPRTLRGHADDIRSIAISPDGSRLVSSSRDGSIRIWDISPELEDPWIREPSKRSRMALSPDGVTLASISNYEGGSIDIWDLLKGEQVHTFTDHSRPVTCLEFSANGKFLASTSRQLAVRIWDLATRACKKILFTPNGIIRLLKFSPDTLRLASLKSNKIEIWDLASGLSMELQCEDGGKQQSINFAMDGRSLAAGTKSGEIQLWDYVSGQCRQRFTSPRAMDHSDEVTCLAFSPDDATLVSGSCGSIAIWRKIDEEFRIVQMLEVDYFIWSVAFSPDGKQIIASDQDDAPSRTDVWDYDASSGSATSRRTLQCTMESYMSSTFRENDDQGATEPSLYGLNEDADAITRNGKLILRLPAPCHSFQTSRLGHLLVQGNTLVLHNSVNGLLILSFFD
ncbi:hypothetical protein V8C44DRAFT_353120 [Trichoderma aethiopicum]